METFMYNLARVVLTVLLRLAFRWRFLGLENIPRTGPVIIAANHISYLDPVCHALTVDRRRRRMRFFAKAELWRKPFLRFVLGSTKMIPVTRGTGEAGPVERAAAVLGRGEAVVLYPEATITTTPDLTPMQGKTGVARLAFATGAPVVPVAVWGSHWVKPKGRKAKAGFRRLIILKAGVPLRFEGMSDRREDPAALREATDQVVAELDRLVREIHKIYPDGGAVPEPKGSA